VVEDTYDRAIGGNREGDSFEEALRLFPIDKNPVWGGKSGFTRRGIGTHLITQPMIICLTWRSINLSQDSRF
jgi:hypothetical protein